MTRVLWRCANALMFLLFAFAVVVQHNDPDPARWMAVYGLAAIAALLEACRWAAWPLALGTACIAGAWAVVLRLGMPEVAPLSSLFEALAMNGQAIEETRELFGLCIVVAWCAVVCCHRLFSRRDTRLDHLHFAS
jgi:hypothetical protein